MTGAETWLDHAANSFAKGRGTADDPYQISTPEELALLSLQNYSSKVTGYYLQTADLSMGQYAWYPIGRATSSSGNVSDAYRFCGNYDGGNYTISGLRFTTMQTGDNAVGLFGYVGNPGYAASGSTIKNVHINSSKLVYNQNANGVVYVGGIVGYFSGWSVYHSIEEETNILNCTCQMNIDAKNSNSVSSDAASNIYVGGIVGYTDNNDSPTHITNCEFDGTIVASGISPDAGGILAVASTITYLDECCANAMIHSSPMRTSIGRPTNPATGGIAAVITTGSTIDKCTFVGLFEIESNYQFCYFGGICASNSGSISDCCVNAVNSIALSNFDNSGLFSGNGTGSVSNCSFVGSGSNSSFPRFGNGTVSGCYAMYNGVGYISDGDFSGWSIVENMNNGLPIQNALYHIAPGNFTSEQITDYLSEKGYNPI